MRETRKERKKRKKKDVQLHRASSHSSSTIYAQHSILPERFHLRQQEEHTAIEQESNRSLYSTFEHLQRPAVIDQRDEEVSID